MTITYEQRTAKKGSRPQSGILSGESVMQRLQRTLTRIKRGLGIVCLSVGMLGFTGIAHAVPVSGKVYLDFDNSGTLTNSPPVLAGVNVELLDNSGAPLLPAITGVTSATGDFSLEAPGIGNYRVKATTAIIGEEGITTVAVNGITPVTGRNVMLKGIGGDLALNIKNAANAGIKNIELVVTAPNMGSLSKATSASGQVIVRNTLSGTTYNVSVSPADIIADVSNGKNYVLWDTTLPNAMNQFVNAFTVAMAGSAQSATFNVRERNDWGADGIVAVDQNGDGLYSADSDTGAAGIQLELYYRGTTTPVVGQPVITTGQDGKYNFKNLALGDYTVKMANITAPWLAVTASSADFSISTATGNPSAFNFLVKIDPNNTTVPKISGYVFALGANNSPAAGPDSGKTGNTVPNSASTYFRTPVSLYQHDGSGWQLIARQTTKSDGSYSFSGLTSGVDYKVILSESGINTGSYYFIGDTDGKSSSSSAASLSSHRGGVTLGNGASDTITGKQIVIPNLTQAKTQQNFWYSAITATVLYVSDYMYTLNENIAWGGTVNGLAGSSMGAPFSGRFYEEDGVTLARKTNGTLLNTATYTPSPDQYTRIGRTATEVDHAGYYMFILDSYDSAYVTVTPTTPLPIAAKISYTTGNGNTLTFAGINKNSIAGYVYINKSHAATGGTYNPLAGDIPVFAARVELYRKQISNSAWNLVGSYASGIDGYYRFTNLPDGDYRVRIHRSFGTTSNVTTNDVLLQGNTVGGTITSTTSDLEVTLTPGAALTNQNHWFQLATTDYLITGNAFLDIITPNVLSRAMPNNENDAPLYGVTVLLCRDGNESDCTVNGPNYIGHQVTNNTGAFSFSGASHSIVANTNYMVKAIKDGLTVVNVGNLAPTYTVSFSGISVPVRLNFLLKGKGSYSGSQVSDLDGNMSYLGNGTSENGLGKTTVHYHDGSAWQSWFTTGFYYNNFSIASLPEGRYKLVHAPSAAQYIDIADSDPASAPGTVEFTVLADGSIADGLPGTNRHFYQAKKYASVSVSGKIYLDVTGNGVKDDRSIELPGSELAGVSVKGFYSPRFYPNYTVGEGTVLANPDFTDNAVSTNNGAFAHTASNSAAGDLYITNYLLKLEGLNTAKYTLVANSSVTKQSYLSSAIQSDLSYMQVNGDVSGSPDQYWLVQLANPTEVSGRLYYDLNGNNSYDSGVDTAMSGVRVELWLGGALYTYTISAADGSYSFVGVLDGAYDVKVTNTGLDVALYELVNPGTGIYNGLNLDVISNPQLLNNDFTYKKTGDASISGYVMLDVNNNGAIDIDYNKQGDVPLENITVELYKNSVSGVPYRTLQTSNRGYYSFSGIDLNTNYIVKVTPTVGYGVIKNVNGTTSDTLAAISIDATPSSHSNQYFLFAGGSNNNPSAGNGAASATNSGLAGKAIIDDGSSTPLAGVLISLMDNSGVELARQLTDGSGNYQFYNLPSGTYQVMVLSIPTNYALVRNSNGTTPPLDSLSSLSVGSSGITGNSFWFTMASADGIQGKVYIDFAADNTSAVVDGNDHPLSAAKVELFSGTGASGTKLGETTTDITGTYKFENLIYGTGVNYSVKIDMSSISNYDFALSKSGNSATNIVINVTNLPLAGSLDNNYFVTGRRSIDGNVWTDINNNLTQDSAELVDGVTITLNYKAPGTSSFVALKSTATGTSPATTGKYVFSKLPSGVDYQVIVDSASAPLAGTSLIPASGANSISGNSDIITFAALAADSSANSTAYRYNGVVSGRLIIDVDSNNAYLSSVDSAFANVELTLTATINSTTIVKTATTDSTGNFTFDNLPIGSWSLTTAATQSISNWSNYTLGFVKNSSGATITGTSALPLTVAVTAMDMTFSGIEVGYKGSAKISGYVVIDMNSADGAHAVSGTDTPIVSATVELNSDATGFVGRTTTTDANGYYEFTGLAAHTYKVTVDSTSSPSFAGYVVSFDPLGTALGSVNIPVTTANSILTTQDFGYKSNGGLSGYIYRDLSGEGTRHSTIDDKLAGVRVKATQSLSGLVLYSNVTAADGAFRIDHLSGGLWKIELDTLPANTSFSYLTDLFGETATVVPNGVEVEIDPTAAFRAVRGATVSFGVRASGAIGGQVVIDVNDQDPLPPALPTVTSSDIAIDTTGFHPGYSVNLYVGSTLVSTQAVVSGAYNFTGLSNNVDYIVEVLSPNSDYVNSFATASSSAGVTAGAVVETTGKMSRTYTLSTNNTVAAGSHFGWKGASGISGDVFWDKDDDGTYNGSVDSDIGAPVTIALTHNSASIPVVTHVIASGSTGYSVSGLLPGSWTVAISGVPTAYKASFDPDNAFSANALAATPNTATVAIGALNLTGQNFGYVRGGMMTGHVKDDNTVSGRYNSSHPGINPVKVKLLDTSGNPILDTNGRQVATQTNASGEFSFRNLDTTRDYKVQVNFGSSSASTRRLTDMEPSYDSEIGAVSLTHPVSSTVNTVNETHTVLAAVSSATNNELTPIELHLGYCTAGADITIHKTALKDNVVVGDIVPYTITIQNNKATAVQNISIKDLIPPGFKFVAGSARLDGKKIKNPTGNRPVYFESIDLGGSGTASSKRTLTYMLVVGAGVTQGKYVNTAEALNRTGKLVSNTSKATVTVTSDPLFNDSLIFGKVYVDRNGNGIQDAGEEGIGGVKLVTARGEIITTDSQGRYHLAGVDGGRWERGTNFVIKLDPRSLPKQYKLKGRNPQVVRLSPGLPSNIDFKVVDR